jgi:hypothetical protein
MSKYEHNFDPKLLEGLVRASRILRPKRIEWDLEHFLIESESVSAENGKAPKPEQEAPSEHPDQDLVHFLRDYQDQKDISVRVLAKEIGLGRTTLQTFLEAQRKAHPRTISRIRRFKNKIEPP